VSALTAAARALGRDNIVGEWGSVGVWETPASSTSRDPSATGTDADRVEASDAAVPHTPTRPHPHTVSWAQPPDEPIRPFLLRGVTGSGKTLVYIELLKEVVQRQGRGAIVLVPEIALTPQTVARFRSHFGDAVAVLHSALSDGERYDAWRALRRGDKRIAVGARSAVFAPIPDLGAIVLDEEHEGSYKQSEAPRYHAREVAIVRASKTGAICLLGSATPSLESWHNARRGKFQLLELPERVEGRPLPPVRVVDLRNRPDAGTADAPTRRCRLPRVRGQRRTPLRPLAHEAPRTPGSVGRRVVASVRPQQAPLSFRTTWSAPWRRAWRGTSRPFCC
ncbi:MAG TPA: primosomal protein N', partial [Longimicrobiales bacterium]